MNGYGGNESIDSYIHMCDKYEYDKRAYKHKIYVLVLHHLQKNII